MLFSEIDEMAEQFNFWGKNPFDGTTQGSSVTWIKAPIITPDKYTKIPHHWSAEFYKSHFGVPTVTRAVGLDAGNAIGFNWSELAHKGNGLCVMPVSGINLCDGLVRQGKAALELRNYTMKGSCPKCGGSMVTVGRICLRCKRTFPFTNHFYQATSSEAMWRGVYKDPSTVHQLVATTNREESLGRAIGYGVKSSIAVGLFMPKKRGIYDIADLVPTNPKTRLLEESFIPRAASLIRPDNGIAIEPVYLSLGPDLPAESLALEDKYFHNIDYDLVGVIIFKLLTRATVIKLRANGEDSFSAVKGSGAPLSQIGPARLRF